MNLIATVTWSEHMQEGQAEIERGAVFPMRRMILTTTVLLATVTASVAHAYQHSVLGKAPLSDDASHFVGGMFVVIVFGGAILFHLLQRDAGEREAKIRTEAQKREEELLKKWYRAKEGLAEADNDEDDDDAELAELLWLEEELEDDDSEDVEYDLRQRGLGETSSISPNAATAPPTATNQPVGNGANPRGSSTPFGVAEPPKSLPDATPPADDTVAATAQPPAEQSPKEANAPPVEGDAK